MQYLSDLMEWMERENEYTHNVQRKYVVRRERGTAVVVEGLRCFGS